MRSRFGILTMCLALLAAVSSAAPASDWASTVIGASNLGPTPYDDASSVLGKPSTLIYEPGYPPNVPAGIFNCSMVYPAWMTDPSGNKLVTTIQEGGYITVRFDQPIYDDPDNWYGRDFIVFGNTAFTANGLTQRDTNMESLIIKNGTEGIWEPMTVSVSQYENGPWYTYSSGPSVDDYAPTQSFAWDWVSHAWGAELDFTRPVDPAFTKSSFGGKAVANAINMYKGSGGGTAFDLANLSGLPVLNQPGDPNNGRKWAQFIKVTANIPDKWGMVNEGEIDAFSRVSHRIDPMPIGAARQLPNGARVVIEPAVVSAATFEVGDCCYVEHADRSSGIRVLGRVLSRGNTLTLYGDMDTVGGERVIRATAVEMGEDSSVSPLGMPVRSVGSAGVGLNSIGLLIRTCGRVRSVDSAAKTFVLDDGSSCTLKCAAPAGSGGFTLPSQNHYVTESGISSCEANGQGGFLPVLRIRDQDDLAVMTE